MAKNQQNGLTQPLDSKATKNSQPTKLFIPGAEDIAWANPESPSTNPETRREKYNIETSGSTVPESWISTNIWPYSTTSLWQQKDTWTTTESMIKPLAWDYASQGGDTAWDLVKKQLDSLWVDEKNKMYGSLVSQTYDNLKQTLYDLWNLNIQWMWIEATQAANVNEVINLTQQVAMAVALGERDPSKIAATLGQDENVIRMILQGKASELVQLNEEYKQRQLRSYYQAAEDYGINIARNMQDFQNYKTYTDNQFNSTMETLKRSLFDSERAARTSSAIFWMTGTKYTLDRIQAQYNQQMRDITDSYQYQSAKAQIDINRAIEDYGKNMERLWIELDEGEKALQAFVLQEMTNLNNSIGLTIQQQEQILGNLRTTIAQTKADGYQKIVSAWEDWNATLASQIAQAYWISWISLSWLGWYYPWTWAEGDLRGKIWVWIANKTNNVWSIKVSATSEALKKLWDEAWIKYTNEWHSNQEWAFWTFETVQDWIKALELALKGRNWSATPRYLKNNGSRAMADLPSNLRDKKINEMTDEEFNSLLRSIIKGENVSAYNLLTQGTGAWTTTAATSDEIKAAQNIYDADVDMLATVQSFYNAYSKIEDVLDMSIDELKSDKWIFKGLSWLIDEYTMVTLRAEWVSTIWDLFYHAVSPDSQIYDKANTLLRRLKNPDLNQAIKTFRQIVNKTFITQLVTAKQAWATFWNLTEWEGRRIETAYNELSATLDFDSMITATNNLINNLNNDLAYMDKLYWNNITKKTTTTNVIPQTLSEQELNSIIFNSTQYASWAGNVQWIWFYNFY